MYTIVAAAKVTTLASIGFVSPETNLFHDYKSEVYNFSEEIIVWEVKIN